MKQTLVKVIWGLEKCLYRYRVFNSQTLVLPDFLGIGAMKSGTTWLYENLRSHPGIYVPEKKELYYFSLRFNRYSLNAYAAQFKPGEHQVKGDITPGYSILPVKRINFIRTVMPDVKLIFLMRNPIHRAWSEAYMNLVEKPGKQMRDVPAEEFLAYCESPACRQRSDYAAIIDRWLSVFPAEQFFSAFLDEVEESPREVLLRLFGFLGIDTCISWKHFPWNKWILPIYERNQMVYRGNIVDRPTASEDLLPTAVREPLMDMYADQLAVLQRRFQAPVHRWCGTVS